MLPHKIEYTCFKQSTYPSLILVKHDLGDGDEDGDDNTDTQQDKCTPEHGEVNDLWFVDKECGLLGDTPLTLHHIPTLALRLPPLVLQSLNITCGRMVRGEFQMDRITSPGYVQRSKMLIEYNTVIQH